MTSQSQPVKDGARTLAGKAVGGPDGGRRVAGALLGLLFGVRVGCGPPKDAVSVPADRSREKFIPNAVEGTAPRPLLVANAARESHLPSYELKMAPKDLAQLE